MPPYVRTCVLACSVYSEVNSMMTDDVSVCYFVQGSQTTFRKIYEEPILLSQQPSATPEEKTLGEARANEVS